MLTYFYNYNVFIFVVIRLNLRRLIIRISPERMHAWFDPVRICWTIFHTTGILRWFRVVSRATKDDILDVVMIMRERERNTAQSRQLSGCWKLRCTPPIYTQEGSFYLLWTVLQKTRNSWIIHWPRFLAATLTLTGEPIRKILYMLVILGGLQFFFIQLCKSAWSVKQRTDNDMSRYQSAKQNLPTSTSCRWRLFPGLSLLAE